MEDKKTVLIVDDIELNRAILCELFRARYEIIEAENGLQAIEMVRRRGQDIAVILLDIVMPIMDGMEVLREMKRGGWIEVIPVIMITAESNEDTALLGYDMGASDIINKPFNPDIVCRRVDNIVELYDHKHHLEAKLREQLAELDEQAKKLKSTNAFVIEALSTAVEFRNRESGSHIKRIQTVTRILLEALALREPAYGITPEIIDDVSSASAMHDIGKIAIPDNVLLKPGRLTAEEFEIMKTHTTQGCALLQSLDYTQDEDYYRYAYDICRHHHERWDGRGYPDGLRGDKISVWAQVVALADVYEALISERVYKPAYPHAKAVRMILEGECGVFNPKLMDCFTSVERRLQRSLEAVEEVHVRPVATHTPPRPSGKSLSDRTLRLLELEREKYRILSELSGEIVFDYDDRTDMIRFSEKYTQVFGGSYTITDMTRFLEETSWISPEDKLKLEEALLKLTPAHSASRIEMQIRTAAGVREWFDVSFHALWNAETQERIGLIGKLTSIHDVKMEATRLRKQVGEDPLTGLYNRKALEDVIRDAVSAGTLASGALLFLDIDDFKRINDTKGHLFGDKVLCCLGDQLRRMFRESDVVGRIGGDEFIVFLQNVSSSQFLQRRAQEICGVFDIVSQRLGCEQPLSGSVGVARFPQDGVQYTELLGKADKALYCAKRNGKNRFAIYMPNMEDWKFRSVLSEVEG